MKKLLLFGLGVIASLSVLTSCKKDTVKPLPSLTMKSDTGYVFNDQSVEAGTKIKLGATIISNDSKLQSVELAVSYDGALASNFVKIMTSEKTYNLDTVYTTRNIAGTEKITIKVTDSNGEIATKDITLTVKKSGAINTFTAKLLGAQYAETGSFLSTTDGNIYTGSTGTANQSAIDLAYYYSGDGTVGNGATIGALDDTNISAAHATTGDFSKWTKNATKFAKCDLTSNEFDALSNDSKFNISSFNDTKETLLKIGDVIAFKTVKGKLGYIKITNLTQGLNTKINKQDFQAGTIEIVVKVQI